MPNRRNKTKGENPQQDEILAQQLLNDKEVAEHKMLVQLGRRYIKVSKSVG